MAAPENAVPAAKARILIVDDSSLMRLYYRTALEKAGYEVEQAANGAEALEKALAAAFALAIVDVNMPGVDGFSFLRALRRSAAEAASLPALMVTTEASQQDRFDARDAGASFYLVKPVAEEELLRHVAVLTGIRL
jgi:two-component system chemotaxis response regulator CheY